MDLDIQEILVQFPAEARNFSLLQSDQTGSQAQPASWSMGTVGSFTREGSSWGVMLASHLQSVLRLRMLVPIPPLPIHLNDMQNDNSAYYATMD